MGKGWIGEQMDKVLITRAPMRICLAGGGTDMPGYYERHGGMVVSATISYYVYTILTSNPLRGIQVMYADQHAVSPSVGREDLMWDSDLGLPKAIAHHFSVCDGATIFLASQVPPGSGLGLSGSVAVSMIKAIAFSCGLDLGPKEVAELACYIEIDKMGLPVGRQDQYASAFGGPNSIEFNRHGVVVEPLRLLPETRQALADGMMLFFLGASCQSSTILMRQRERIQRQDSDTMRRLGAVRDLAMAIRVALESGDLNGFGQLLHRSWMEKREIVSGITNPALDQCYQEALHNGALGGNVTGAGGGGFMVLFCPVARQQAVTEALAALCIQRWPCVLEDEGVQVMQSVPWSRQQALPAVPWTQSPVLQHTPFTARGPA